MTPLAGIRVLDLTRVLAGPICAQYLGDMGADVIKIEPTDHGDDMRIWPPFRHGTDGTTTGTPYLGVNRNKRSVAIDLRAPEGRDLLARLADTVDIVIESFAPGSAARAGADAASLRARNPRLIHCSITGYGSTGPMRHGRGYDLIAQAFAGMLAMTGERNGPPVRAPYSPVDQATGLHAMVGILAALHARHTSGVGAAIEASLFDSATGFLSHMLQNYWERGTEPERHGVGHESLCPYEAFATADKPIILGVANDSMWRTFCKLADLGEAADDPRFLGNGDRVRNRTETVRLVAAALRTRSRDEWLGVLEAAGIPCSPLHTMGELAAHPHTRESGMLMDYEHPQFGALHAVAQPIKIDGERGALRLPPPALGEHTIEVLRTIGLDDAAIAMLRTKGVIRCMKEAS